MLIEPIGPPVNNGLVNLRAINKHASTIVSSVHGADQINSVHNPFLINPITITEQVQAGPVAKIHQVQQVMIACLCGISSACMLLFVFYLGL